MDTLFDMNTANATVTEVDFNAPNAKAQIARLYPREESEDTVPAPDGSDAERYMAEYLAAGAEIARLEAVQERAAVRLMAAIGTNGGIEGVRAMASWRTVMGRVNWPALVGSLKVDAKRLEKLKAKFRGLGHRELRVRARV